MLMKRRTALLLVVLGAASSVRATIPNAADGSIHQFLTKDDTQHPYRAIRRLEAKNGSRSGWLEATTEYTRESGFQYRITAEGGSNYIREKVLRGVLEGEQEVIARGETAHSSLARTNYSFQANGVDADGLANVLISPLRKERVLVDGTMFLEQTGGDLVRLQGRLAKSPSFWIRNVDIVRSYKHIGQTVVPVKLESNAQVRFLGAATLRMTYVYTEVDGQPVSESATTEVSSNVLRSPGIPTLQISLSTAPANRFRSPRVSTPWSTS
jgi:hypothetical protein